MGPLSFAVQGSRDDTTRGQPTLAVDAQLNAIPMRMTTLQLEDAVHLHRSVEYFRKFRYINAARPTVGVFEDPKGWWAYLRVCLQLQRPARQQFKWNHEAFEARCRYVELYKQDILMDEDERELAPVVGLEAIERSHHFTVAQLIVFR